MTVPSLDEIDSTFQQMANVESDSRFPGYVTEAYQGTHVFEDYAVTRTFTVERFDDYQNERLAVFTRYDIDGNQVGDRHTVWKLTDDGEHVEHSGESIEEFCRSNHFADPQSDIEGVIAEGE